MLRGVGAAKSYYRLNIRSCYRADRSDRGNELQNPHKGSAKLLYNLLVGYVIDWKTEVFDLLTLNKTTNTGKTAALLKSTT